MIVPSTIIEHAADHSNSKDLLVKSIVYYKGYNALSSVWGEQFLKDSGKYCNGLKCTITNRQKGQSIEGFDMVVMKQPMDQIPPRKSANQLWVYHFLESQRYSVNIDLESWDGMFNYTMTYIRSSESNGYDLNYGTNAVKREQALPEVNYHQKKLGMVGSKEANALWLVSDCDLWVQSLREEQVLNLTKHMPVDAFSHDEQCKRKLNNTLGDKFDAKNPYNAYWFYLAYENSLCRDYITEKFWKIIASDSLTIPVVLGGYSMKDYEIVAPPNSYIDVRNFTSAKHLAEHLKYVTENEDAFNYYHQWRNEYQIPTYKYKAGKSGPMKSGITQSLSMISIAGTRVYLRYWY